MKAIGWIVYCIAVWLADSVHSQPFTFNDPAFVGQSAAPQNYSSAMIYLPLTNAPAGTLLSEPLLVNGMVPTDTDYGILFSPNAVNQFAVSTNGPRFQTPIQVGNAIYSGTEAQSIEMTNDLPYSTIEFTMPVDGLPYLSVAGFVKIPPLANAAATYDLVVFGTAQTNPPYLAEDWVLQISCGPTNYLGMEDASSANGTTKLNWSPFPTDQWLYFTMTINTTNLAETALVLNASDWSVILSATNAMSVTNAFLNYWLFGNNEAGSQDGVNFWFSGLNWTNTPPPLPQLPLPYTSPTNQLIAQYKFNGDFSDASPNQFDGGGWGGIDWTVGQDGVTNHAVNLTSATVSSLATNPVSALTISYWLKTTTGDGIPIAHTELTSWSNYIDPHGHVRLSLGTTDDDIEIQTTNAVVDGNWHLVTCTWDSTGDQMARIYVDGVLDDASAPLSGTIVPAYSQMTIGSGIFGDFFSGALDDVRVYGRALNADEVSKVYAAGADGDINL